MGAGDVLVRAWPVPASERRDVALRACSGPRTVVTVTSRVDGGAVIFDNPADERTTCARATGAIAKSERSLGYRREVASR